MPRSLRSLFPWIAGLGILSALGWALNKGRLEPADFTFVNGTEVKSLDPAIVTGQPENRMINALFEGLVQWHPETLEPVPGVAERWEVSDNKLTYTFYLRDAARWSDNTPVTAGDFYYSMRRFLDPRTAAEYAYQAWYIKNARRYSGGGGALQPGDPIEVELLPSSVPWESLVALEAARALATIVSASPQAVAPPIALPQDVTNTQRGPVITGKLLRIEKGEDAKAKDPTQWVFVVAIDGREQRFRYVDAPDDATAESLGSPNGVRWCRQVLLDFREVGIEVLDERIIRFTLEHPTPYFLNLLGYYPLFPVQKACVERHGSPEWTDPANIVCNGPFKPLFRHLRDRTRVVKNELYWNRDEVKLRSVDFLANESVTTGLNLYLTGKVDWIYDIPPPALRVLLKEKPPRDDLNPQPVLITYMYLLNTTRKPLDDVRVRRALSLAMDRGELTTRLLAGGEQPAYSLVPPGMPDYEAPQCEKENREKARRLLAEAGYEGGRGFPELEILYNTHEGHQAIAQLIRKQWQKTLGIRVRTRNEEFATVLSNQRALNYEVSRLSWIGDYADPNTYLDMFTTGADNNRTGWGSPEYDQLIADAAKETDAENRLEMLRSAEQILMDELPIIPFYFYVSKNMVKPYVRGFYNNVQDHHPLHAIWLDYEQKTPNPFLKGRR